MLAFDLPPRPTVTAFNGVHDARCDPFALETGFVCVRGPRVSTAQPQHCIIWRGGKGRGAVEGAISVSRCGPINHAYHFGGTARRLDSANDKLTHPCLRGPCRHVRPVKRMIDQAP